MMRIADTCCLALCYLYAACDEDEGKAVVALLRALDDDTVLDTDATVKDASELIRKYGKRKCIVTKSTVLQNGYCCGNYEYNGKNHWVLFKAGKMIYNSLEHSVCVANGKLTDVRVLNFQ